jgi:membrane-associated phospholipid phosphatase
MGEVTSINKPFLLELPYFITTKNKIVWGIVSTALTSCLYLSSNHFHFFEPQLLTMSYWDELVPFFPHSIWVYASEYIYFFSVCWVIKKADHLNRLFYSFMSLQIISAIIFIFWPTTYPRELFPLPNSLDFLTHLIFNSIRELDSPANCCPSLHVSSVLICALSFLKSHQEKFWIFFIWSLGISATTVTTKQHYIIDVITGISMAIIAHWFFHTKVNYVFRPSSLKP